LGLLQLERTINQTGDQLLEMRMHTVNFRFTAAETLGHTEFVLPRLFESA
jgi:(2R)-sulfolactate sulfo-lyase subunit beta